MVICRAGYGRYVDELAVALEDRFGVGVVEVIGLQDSEITGNFEITLVQTGELIHSRATRNQGVCQSELERNQLFAKIQSYLDTTPNVPT